VAVKKEVVRRVVRGVGGDLPHHNPREGEAVEQAWFH
jgi:hypothetical protein